MTTHYYMTHNMTHRNGQVKPQTPVLMRGRALHCVMLLTLAVVMSTPQDRIVVPFKEGTVQGQQPKEGTVPGLQPQGGLFREQERFFPFLNR